MEIRWSDVHDPADWSPVETISAGTEIARFPMQVLGGRPAGDMIIVDLEGGVESRLVRNKRRGWIIPRRWRKPR